MCSATNTMLGTEQFICHILADLCPQSKLCTHEFLVNPGIEDVTAKDLPGLSYLLMFSIEKIEGEKESWGYFRGQLQ